MKLFPAILCTILGALTGFYKSAELKSRQETLSELVSFLDEIAIKIRYIALPVTDIISETAESGYKFPKAVNKKIKENKEIYNKSAWEEAVLEFPKLNSEEREVLLSIGKNLGNSDVTGQLSMLAMNKILLERHLEKATADNNRKGKMYRSSGLLIGLGLGIMII